MQCSACRPSGEASTWERPLSSSTRWKACGPSPGVTPLHVEVYGFIRSPVEERGSSCRNTSRSVQVGTSFSTPITVISVSGSVRHIRPLPSDSTTEIVPVSATAKLAPEIADLRGEELPAQVGPRGHREPAGLVGERRVHVRHLAQEDVADLGAVAVDRGDEEVRRPVVRELHDQLGEVGLQRRDARALERLVESGLLGGHRLDLDDLVARRSPGPGRRRCGWPPRRRAPSAPTPPRAVTLSSSSTSSSGSRVMVSALIASPARRSSSQSPTSATTPARLARMVRVACPRLRRSWVSASARCAAAGKDSVPRRWPYGSEATVGMPRGTVLTSGPPRRRDHVDRAVVGVGTGQDLGQVDRPYPGAQARESAADVHEARRVPGGADLGLRAEHARHLVRQHRRRGLGVLHRERPAEPAADVGVGQLHQVQPANRAQQLQGLVADAQHPQRVARRVVGDPVRVVGADVGHPQHVDQELGELVRPLGALLGRARQPLVPRAAGDHRVLVAHAARRTSPTGPRSRRPPRRGRGRRPPRGGAPPAGPRPGSRCSRASDRNRSGRPGRRPRAPAAPAASRWRSGPGGTARPRGRSRRRRSASAALLPRRW